VERLVKSVKQLSCYWITAFLDPRLSIRSPYDKNPRKKSLVTYSKEKYCTKIKQLLGIRLYPLTHSFIHTRRKILVVSKAKLHLVVQHLSVKL